METSVENTQSQQQIIIHGHDIHTQEVIEYLLANNFLLTALELLLECEEVERSEEVQQLRHFFSDQNKFPTAEVEKFQDVDAMRRLNLQQQREERLNFAEYQLRVTKEDVADLRSKLQGSNQEKELNPGQSDVGSSWNSWLYDEDDDYDDMVDHGNPSNVKQKNSKEVSKETRKALLNAIVEYLQLERFQTTMQTFLAELDGRGVTLQMPQQQEEEDGQVLEVVQWRRAYMKLAKVRNEFQSFQKENSELQQQLEQSKNREQELQDQLEQTQYDYARLQQELDRQIQMKDDLQKQYSNELQPKYHPNYVLENHVNSSSLENSKIYYDRSASSLLMNLVSESLQKILPSVLINKREDVVPLLIATIREHPDSKQREQLGRVLFNLVKKPTKSQRKVILEGMRQLSKELGPVRAGKEVIPLVWEQVIHKSPERRTLVAECCGYLVDVLSTDTRGNILETWKQMAVDSEGQVRAGIARALFQTLIQGQGIKNFDEMEVRSVTSLVLQLTVDTHEETSTTISDQVLPKLLDYFQTDQEQFLEFCLEVLNRLKIVLDDNPRYYREQGTDSSCNQSGSQQEQSQMRHVRDVAQIHAKKLLQVFSKLLPVFRIVALKNCPSWVLSEYQDGALDYNVILERQSCPVRKSLSEDVRQLVNINYSPAGDSAHALQNGDAVRKNTSSNAKSHNVDASNPFETNIEVQDQHQANNNPFEIYNSQQLSDTKSSLQAFESNSILEQISLQQMDSESTNPFASMDLSTIEVANNNPFFAFDLAPELSSPNKQPEASSMIRSISDKVTSLQAFGSTIETLMAETVQEQSNLAEDNQFGKSDDFRDWLDGDKPSEWIALDVFFRQLLPTYLECIMHVAPLEPLEGLRRRLALTLRQTVMSMGQQTIQRAILPMLLTCSSVPQYAWPAVVKKDKIPEYVYDQINRVQPSSEEEKLDGILCVFPMTLVAGLPAASHAAFNQTIKALCREEQDGTGVWALENYDEMLAAIKFAGSFDNQQSQLTLVLWDLISSRHTVSGMCGGLIATALAPCMDEVGIQGHILPALQQMIDSGDSDIKQCCILAISEVIREHSRNALILERCHKIYETLLSEGDADTRLALLRSLPEQVGRVSAGHVEWFLQRMMFMLAKMHVRASSGMGHRGMQQVAEAIFNALYTIQSCQLADYKVQLHLVAAMESLKREGDLLSQSHREYLSEMLKEESDSVSLNAPHEVRELALRHSRSASIEQLTDDGGHSTPTADGDTDERRPLEMRLSMNSSNDEDSTSVQSSKSIRRLLGRLRKNSNM